MARFVSFCAFFILIISATGAVALSQPLPAIAQETPHTTNPSPSVAVHGTFSQPTTAYLPNKDGGGGVGITGDPIHAFPVMLIAAMLMTCAAASIIARDRTDN